MQLGQASKNYLMSVAPGGTSITLLMEKQNLYDTYGRTLAYVLTQDGNCLNEKMISEGYAKAFDRYFCKALPYYQTINFTAKQVG